MAGIGEQADYQDAEAIDLICDEFERQFHNRNAPQLEDLLLRVDQRLRTNLLFELLQVEFSSLWSDDRDVELSLYIERFPDFIDTIRQAHEHFLSQPAQANRVRKGTTFGHYAIEACLGSGAHAAVYRAFDSKVSRSVALKILHTDLPDGFAEMLVHEARAAAHVDGPGFCPIYEVGYVGERRYISMRLVEGKSLKQLLRERGRLPSQEAVAIVFELAKCLQKAHQRGILHRDLKPANVLIDDDGKPVITDFGLAHRSDATGSWSPPLPIAGSPAYMAPELWEDKTIAPAPSQDVYSLGIVLYELLFGDRPTQSDGDEVQIAFRSAPKRLRSIIQKAIAREPSDRYSSMEELASALRRYQNARRFVRITLIPFFALGFAALLFFLFHMDEDPRLDAAKSTSPTELADNASQAIPVNIGVVRRMPGEDNYLWLLESSFESINPKRDMDVSFGGVNSDGFLLAGRWEPGDASYPAAIEVVDGVLVWRLYTDSAPEHVLTFGIENDLPQAADWTGDGVDECIVVRRGRGQTKDDTDSFWHWLVSKRGDTSLFADLPFMEAKDGDIPITGVWDASIRGARPGIARPSNQTGKYEWFFYESTTTNDRPSVVFGSVDGTPVVGDFNGDGLSDIAVVEPGEIELIWKFDFDRNGTLDSKHAYGLSGDVPIVGTWKFPEVRVTLENGSEIFPTNVVSLNEQSSTTFTVSNPGTVPLLLEDVQIVTGGFRVLQELTRRELPPGASDTFEIEHEHGIEDGVIAFRTNDPNEFDFRFAIQPPTSSENWNSRIHRFLDDNAVLTETGISPKQPETNSGFGRAIATSEDILVVGAPEASQQAGAAYVFRKEGTRYIQVAELVSDNPATGDKFGYSVDIYGDTVVVGSNPSVNSGYACIFQRASPTSDDWGFVKRLKKQNDLRKHRFGASVAISADTAVIGCYGASFHHKGKMLRNGGTAYVYQRDAGGINNWAMTQELYSPSIHAREHFGYSVDIHRDAIVVGSYSRDEQSRLSSAYWFKRQTGGGWRSAVELRPKYRHSFTEFGTLVTTHGRVIAVAATAEKTKLATDTLYLYYGDGHAPEKWLPLNIKSPFENATYSFGAACAFSRDGLLMLVTSIPANLTDSGRTFLYSRPTLASADWKLARELTPSTVQASATFGHSVAFHRDTILIGDPRTNTILAFQCH